MSSYAADYPAPQEATWIARDFRFNTGESLPEVKLNYRTIGEPTGEPVLVLHGTNGSSGTFLNANFAGELFGAGQPLDASKFFIILPDALGSGKSSKPSDGLRGKFPQYNYNDMVQAQYRLVTEGLGIKHLRLVIGDSAGGMQTWQWAGRYPQMMDIAVPMASQPTEMAGRNWIMRRMLTESIRRDPAWMNGNYTKQPTAYLFANAFFGFATNGGTQAYYRLAPNREKGDKMVAERLDAAAAGDANDFLYRWDASRDYDASPQLEAVEAHLLAINATDDERNPPELGIMEREIKRVKHGKLLIIPASPDTRGHGTTGAAKFWKAQLAEALATAPRR